jgi:purine-nucleoside phosphorylase
VIIKPYNESIKYIKYVSLIKPKIALVLGSGLKDFVKEINIISCIDAAKIPNYPVSSVQGHAGKLVFGYLRKDIKQSIPLLIFEGRVHYYENESIFDVIYPITIAHSLGIRKLIITNAAGGINNHLVVGDLMLIVDILDLTFMKYLLFKGSSINPRIKYFDNNLKKVALQSSAQLSIPLHQGTYCWLKGPSYETPAEIQMLRRIGADAVGMSTVPEIITANILGMKILALSLISNLASGISQIRLSHGEIMKAAYRINDKFARLIENIVLSSE